MQMQCAGTQQKQEGSKQEGVQAEQGVQAGCAGRKSAPRCGFLGADNALLLVLGALARAPRACSTLTDPHVTLDPCRGCDMQNNAPAKILNMDAVSKKKFSQNKCAAVAHGACACCRQKVHVAPCRLALNEALHHE